MPVVVLTVTQSEVATFSDRDWHDIENQLGLSKANVLAMYGEHRNDWKPLGGADDIVTLLNRLEELINGRITGPAARYFWEPAPDAF
jgi:hypothetical protein